ncbi:MAG: flavin reductase [Clostridia bacterium]|nr:flavin reductase [Clostridia bacterium]
MEFTMDIFKQFDKKWALLTAGTEESFNTMTISWGGMGTIWNKPAVTVYVRESRYTHEFMDGNDYFTVSFYPEQYKKELGVLGSRSGRNMDKMTVSGLTAMKAGESMTFKEAEVTLVCKKLYKQRLLPENMPKDVVDTMYADNDIHDMYIGEIVDMIR